MRTIRTQIVFFFLVEVLHMDGQTFNSIFAFSPGVVLLSIWIADLKEDTKEACLRGRFT